VVDYGAGIPHVSREVQRHVREYLHGMTDVIARAVNVVVGDVQR
jgi:uncharacterized alkaline shock family protein YloU